MKQPKTLTDMKDVIGKLFPNFCYGVDWDYDNEIVIYTGYRLAKDNETLEKLEETK